MQLKREFRLLMSLTAANLKSRYRNTVYGFLWVVLNPMMIYLAQVFAFSMIFQINFPNYPLYLLGGLLPWLFIVQSVEMCTGIFIYNAHTLKNLPINPLILPMSQMIDNFINFLSAFLILLTYFIFKGQVALSVLFFLVIPILLLFVFATSLSIILAIINIRYRDTKFIVSFIFTILYFLTPIFYSINIVSGHLKFFLAKNPFYLVISPFQNLLMNGVSKSLIFSMLPMFYIALGLLLLCFWVWSRMKKYVGFYA